MASLRNAKIGDIIVKYPRHTGIAVLARIESATEHNIWASVLNESGESANRQIRVIRSTGKQHSGRAWWRLATHTLDELLESNAQLKVEIATRREQAAQREQERLERARLLVEPEYKHGKTVVSAASPLVLSIVIALPSEYEQYSRIVLAWATAPHESYDYSKGEIVSDLELYASAHYREHSRLVVRDLGSVYGSTELECLTRLVAERFLR